MIGTLLGLFGGGGGGGGSGSLLGTSSATSAATTGGQRVSNTGGWMFWAFGIILLLGFFIVYRKVTK